jgi:starch synthase (maltosyl-transferring)
MGDWTVWPYTTKAATPPARASGGTGAAFDRRRVILEDLAPAIDAGRFPIKRVVGERVDVSVTLFADGHEQPAGSLLFRHVAGPIADETAWNEVPLAHVGDDRWTASFTVREVGRYQYTVRGWIARHEDEPTVWDPPLQVVVDPIPALFSAWYEMFPRSCTPDPTRSGTFREAESRLPDIAAMGFDVLYLPPVHPIGRSFRKGRNNTLTAGPGDPGSPWGIGSEDGGHTAVEPGLGTLDDFDRFVEVAGRHGLAIALDIAFQTSPDHPWVHEHPEWFRKRPDGTIQYAENPPKKYQDIYPLDFSSPEHVALWEELRYVFLFWISHGVTIFRVDNPHTKAFRFWEWCIDQIKREHPEVIFLSEAFTRPVVMRYLAKAGFTQSYTYFTWRNTAAELRDYLTELTQTEVREYLRPNFFANTPDILTEYLQHGGRPAFAVRLVLAATLSASYGIYSGFELCENTAVRPGSEEYLDSEKYQIKPRDWRQPGNLAELIARVNTIRRDHPALQQNASLTFHPCDNPALLWFSKSTIAHGTTVDEARPDHVFVVANTDPQWVQHGWVELPLADLGLPADAAYEVEDLLDGARYRWRGARNYVRLDPAQRPAHIFVVRS